MELARGIEIEFTIDPATGEAAAFIHCPAGFALDDAEAVRALEALLGPASEADLPLEYVERLLAEQQVRGG